MGVFAGVSDNGYGHRLAADPELLAAVGRFQIALGNEHDYLATRISYKLDLRGPSLTVQTACSTSLVAVHLAAQSLLRGECDLALAGGASVQLREVTGYLYQQGGIASPDGHCRAFDAAAQGVVSGSGVGVVVLKRLADALADGDAVRAVVLGSAINNDGARQGRLHRPRRRRAGRGDPRRPGRRRRRPRHDRLRRGARHRHPARRSDRGGGADPGVPGADGARAASAPWAR